MRAKLDTWIEESGDRGRESEACTTAIWRFTLTRKDDPDQIDVLKRNVALMALAIQE